MGHITGGLGHVSILSSMFFGGICGSAVAETAAIGGLLIPPMKEQGFPAPLAAAICASAAVIGIIIPPSIPFILFGIITSTSIARIFLGGIVPGVIVGLALMITTYFITKKKGIARPDPGRKFSLRRVWTTLVSAGWALSIPIIIVGGILGGVFTATEAGAVSAFVAMILGLFVYKEISWRDLPGIFLSTGKSTATVLYLCGMAMCTAWLLTRARVPFELAALVQSITESQLGVLLMTNVLLFFVGFVMDLTPAMLILAPILLPMMQQVGIDPVYFGVLMSVNLGIGLITPPVGTVLYVATGVAGIKFDELVKSIAPFVVAELAVLVLLIFFPQVILFVPNLVMP